jgi:hypothetical protein
LGNVLGGLTCIGVTFFVVYVAMRQQVVEAIAVTMFVCLVLAMLIPIPCTPREASRRMWCSNNMHNIVLALQNYHDVYGSFPPAYVADKNGKPNYVAVVGPRTMWPGETATKMADVKDGTSNTLLIVETYGTGIHWMEPLDLDAVQMSMAINPPRGSGISSMHPKVAQAAFVDGSVRALAEDTPLPVVRAMLTIDGGEKAGVP